jgi:hypothetical protein
LLIEKLVKCINLFLREPLAVEYYTVASLTRPSENI